MGFVDAFSELTKKELSFQKEERDKLRLQLQKKVNDFDFNFQPQINKNEILDLHSLRFMDTTDNTLFIGTSGVGETHLAISIALEAKAKERSCYFALSNELVERLSKAHKRGTLESTLNKYIGYDILIIDEVGYLPFSQDWANLLFQFINRRYEKKSTIITTNIPLSQWAYNNAGTEAFHASLKKEEVYTSNYSDFEEANRALFSYIEGFYNRNRIHSSIHYQTKLHWRLKNWQKRK